VRHAAAEARNRLPHHFSSPIALGPLSVETGKNSQGALVSGLKGDPFPLSRPASGRLRGTAAGLFLPDDEGDEFTGMPFYSGIPCKIEKGNQKGNETGRLAVSLGSPHGLVAPHRSEPDFLLIQTLFELAMDILTRVPLLKI